LIQLEAVANWAVQVQFQPPDSVGNCSRRLTMGWKAPGQTFDFMNLIPTYDGTWGLISPSITNLVRDDQFILKFPPWPTPDGVDRTTYIPNTFTVTAPNNLTDNVTGASVQFGYVEFGSSNSFYCSSRQEVCIAGFNTSHSEPFFWESEEYIPFPCSNGECNVTVLVIPLHVAYFQVIWHTSSDEMLNGPVGIIIESFVEYMSGGTVTVATTGPVTIPTSSTAGSSTSTGTTGSSSCQSCPANSHCSFGSCVCNSGYDLEGGNCVEMAESTATQLRNISVLLMLFVLVVFDV